MAAPGAQKPGNPGQPAGAAGGASRRHRAIPQFPPSPTATGASFVPGPRKQQQLPGRLAPCHMWGHGRSQTRSPRETGPRVGEAFLPRSVSLQK